MCLLPRDLQSFILTCPHIVTRGWRVIFCLARVCRLCTCLSRASLFQLVGRHYMILYNLCTYLIHASWLTSAIQRSLSEFFYQKHQGSVTSSAKLLLINWGNSGSLYQAMRRSWVSHVGFVHEWSSNLSLVLFSHFLLFLQSLDCWRWWMVSTYVLFAGGLKADRVRTRHKFVGYTYVILDSASYCGWSYALATVSSTHFSCFHLTICRSLLWLLRDLTVQRLL